MAEALEGIGSTTVRDMLRGPHRAARGLGGGPSALYFRLPEGDVIALLTSDAVRLPLGIVLGFSRTQRRLDRLTGPIIVGGGKVQVAGCAVELSHVVSVQAPTRLTPDETAARQLHAIVRTVEFAEHEPALLDRLVREYQNPGIAGRLLGAGSGLTPSGDDILAGFLVAARSFELAIDRLRAAVLAEARDRTTDLSAALLAHASRGESIPQVNALLAALCAPPTPAAQLDRAVAGLIRVGHTSGVALATGVALAAAAWSHCGHGSGAEDVEVGRLAADLDTGIR
jgi:hypothetical protein